jgi:hypothetical protein
MKLLPAIGIRLALGITAISLISIAPTNAWAQEKFKFVSKPGTGATKYIQQHVLDVNDVPGHQIRVAQLQTKFSGDAPEFAGVKEVESNVSLMSDYINGSGHFTQYVVTMMANGDKLYWRIEGISQTSIGADGSRKAAYSTVETLTGGTGKFASIRGTLRASGVSDFKTGVTANPTEGEYWFDK